MKKHPSHPNRRQALALGVCALTGAPLAARAASYPDKPIRLVVPFAAGGGSDFIGRLLAQRMQEKLGQPVIVDNRPGAGGNLGASTALKSPADGYTLLLTAASYCVNPALYKLNFDPVNDITPISQLARGPFLIAANPKLPIKDLAGLVALAKSQPGKLSYASAGTGSVTQLATEYFLDVAGLQVTHIPYKGTSPALSDTIGGQVDFIFGTVASTLPFAKSNQLRTLAVTTPQRLPALPQVPTVREAGFDYEVTNWHGLLGPRGLPAAIVAKLGRAVHESMEGDAMASKLASDGLVSATDTPDAFRAQLLAEMQRWSTVVKKRGVKVE